MLCVQGVLCGVETIVFEYLSFNIEEKKIWPRDVFAASPFNFKRHVVQHYSLASNDLYLKSHVVHCMCYKELLSLTPHNHYLIRYDGRFQEMADSRSR